jgi:hypothetical protein
VAVRRKLTAERAIANAQARQRLPDLTPEAAEELRKLCAYNDACAESIKRVGAPYALIVLANYGWPGKSYAALNKVCRIQLGRRSYAVP